MLYSLSRKEGWRRYVDAPARQRPEPLTAAQLLPAEAALHAVPDVHGDDEDAEEIFDDPADGGFYADAFEILE